MGINRFIYLILFGAIITISLGFDITKSTSVELDQPLIEFDDATMYTMDKERVTNIIKAKKALRYEDKDELYDANVVMRVKGKDNILDILSAKRIVKTGDDMFFRNEVKYNRGETMEFESEVLNYNLKTKIAQNRDKFVALYNGDHLNGTHLYIDSIKDIIKAEKTKFIIDMDKK